MSRGHPSAKDIDLLDMPIEERPLILEEDAQYPVSFDAEDIEWRSDDVRIVRVDEVCAMCGGNWALHPHHARPRGMMLCADCPGAGFGMGRFWREPTLSSFDQGGDR